VTTYRQKRGEFTPIARALLDGPDFQRLAPVARHLFLTLKVALGPSGIEVHYPAALTATLAAITGWTEADVTAALEQLRESGWIEREAHVLWIVAQLQFHPGMVESNEKHRRGVQNHVAGLPRLAIVRRFIERYAGFFSDAPGVLDAYPITSPPTLSLVTTDPIATPLAIEGLSNHAVRSTQDEIPNTQNEERSCASDDAPAGSDPLTGFPEFWTAYPKRKGTNSRKAAEKCWRARRREGETVEVMMAGVEQYAAHCDAEAKTGTPFVMQACRFLGSDKHYLEVEAFSTDDGPNPPIILPQGEGLTEYGRAVTDAVPNPKKVAALRADWRRTPDGRQAMAEWRAGRAPAAPRIPRAQPEAQRYASALGGAS
jgi:hypothetical protein